MITEMKMESIGHNGGMNKKGESMNGERNRSLWMVLALLLVLVGCGGQSTPAPTAAPTAVPAETPVQVVEDVATMAPTQAPTPAPTEVPTPAPTDTPAPTREPEEGDVCVNFPNYDTGTEADYSYQSDELRIAIDKVVDEENVLTYFVADIWMRNYRCFRTAFGNGEFNGGEESATDISRREKAILGISGSFNNGFVLHNGVFYKGTDKEWSKDLLALYKTGELKTYYYETEDFKPKEAVDNGVWQGWQFGPILIHDGVPVEGYKPNATRQPRCMIGYYEPGHYVIVMVDGRQAGYSIGMNFYECIEFMHSLGCVEAYNLDGGESIRMTFMGEIINHPSGDRDGDGVADRNLIDMLVFAEYDPEGNAPEYEEVANKIRVRNGDE